MSEPRHLYGKEAKFICRCGEIVTYIKKTAKRTVCDKCKHEVQLTIHRNWWRRKHNVQHFRKP